MDDPFPDDEVVGFHDTYMAENEVVRENLLSIPVAGWSIAEVEHWVG
jgi:hypothetical protein